VTGDALFIRPGVEHRVDCPIGGIRVVYLNGLATSEQGPVARRLRGKLLSFALDAFAQIPDAERELRERLSLAAKGHLARLGPIIREMADEPMSRMTQGKLSACLRMERTSALKTFKAATGQTFRQFKRWSALQHAARQIAAGASVRTAAMDAGFADTAHLSRFVRSIAVQGHRRLA
jgi:AraC-like DNA-binding protein